MVIKSLWSLERKWTCLNFRLGHVPKTQSNQWNNNRVSQSHSTFVSFNDSLSIPFLGMHSFWAEHGDISGVCCGCVTVANSNDLACEMKPKNVVPQKLICRHFAFDNSDPEIHYTKTNWHIMSLRSTRKPFWNDLSCHIVRHEFFISFHMQIKSNIRKGVSDSAVEYEPCSLVCAQSAHRAFVSRQNAHLYLDLKLFRSVSIRLSLFAVMSSTEYSSTFLLLCVVQYHETGCPDSCRKHQKNLFQFHRRRRRRRSRRTFERLHSSKTVYVCSKNICYLSSSSTSWRMELQRTKANIFSLSLSLLLLFALWRAQQTMSCMWNTFRYAKFRLCWVWVMRCG